MLSCQHGHPQIAPCPGGTANTSTSLSATAGLPKARYLKGSAPASIQACDVDCNFRRNTRVFLDSRRQLAIAVSTRRGFPETAYTKQITA